MQPYNPENPYYGEPRQQWPGPYYPPYYGGVAYPTAARPASRWERNRVPIAIAGVAVIAAACATAGFVTGRATVVTGSGTAAASAQVPQSGNGNFPGFPSGGSGSTGSSGSSGGSTGTATAAQSAGVVDIDTVLGYQNGAAAGTGTIVTANGEVLTNNHVVQGSTKVKVTVVSTGKSYSATVVGTDATDDIAVLQMSGASGLTTAAYGNSAVKVGDAVTGVGNAGGSGGTPSAASGRIVALNQSLTATDDSGGNAENLTGMIETNAPIVPGDSGGPLYNSSNQVVGVDTAAQTGRFGSTVTSFAIPIGKALAIAQQIESGKETATVHIGTTGFLGVSVADGAQGALVETVVNGSPAAAAGIQSGDVITAVNGKPVASPTALHSLLSTSHGGDHVSVSWSDASGGSHSASVTLVAGPAA